KENCEAKGYCNDGYDLERRGDPLLSNSEEAESSHPNRLIKACDWIAMIFLSVLFIEMTSLVICVVLGVSISSKIEPWDLMFQGVLIGSVAVLYGTVRSLYQLIYYARHSQNIPALDKFMQCVTLLITPLNILLLTIFVINMRHIFFSLNIFLMHSVALFLSLFNLYINIKRSKTLAPMTLIQSFIVLYWASYWLIVISRQYSIMDRHRS
ncbi:unnamed protein product, partial [Auanema sp. JU1783]